MAANTAVVNERFMAASSRRYLEDQIPFCSTDARWRASVSRVLPSVNVSDSRGMLVANGRMSHPRPVGRPRVSEIASHCT